ncbi:MAG: methyltransferase domain-containing protein [Oscillospiraceae bacterium]|nr:methyltransferase domain-containing protein [Oscillospiraceae bacterium]
MNVEKFYTVDDVAAYTNLTSRTIRNYLKDGTLKGRKVGGQWRFTMQNINAISERKNDGENSSVSRNNQFLLDFISGVNINITSELQTCSVTDYYCKRIEDATVLSQEFSEIQANIADDEPDAKYLYYYEPAEQKARYIFFGSPDTISLYMQRLSILHEQLETARKQFQGRSENYLTGRPDYPKEFFKYLYNDYGIKQTDIIADIGSGIGTMSKHFLEKGNTVYCIEPNQEMKILSDELLSNHQNYISLLKTAENTSLTTNSIDYIVCGNAYLSFNKALAIQEFNRILKKKGKIIITHYYPDIKSDSEGESLWNEFKNEEKIEKDKRLGNEFADGTAIRKTFYYTYYQDFYHFLSGCLSSAAAPKIGDERYEYFVNRIKQDFDKNSVNNMMECKFRLLCLIGDINNLI